MRTINGTVGVPTLEEAIDACELAIEASETHTIKLRSRLDFLKRAQKACKERNAILKANATQERKRLAAMTKKP